MKKQEYDIGDRAIIKCKTCGHGFKIGEIVTITTTYGDCSTWGHKVINDDNVEWSVIEDELKPIEKMEKEIKIVPPTGYEIDKENSTLVCIKFKLLPPKKKENKITNLDFPREDVSINSMWAFSIMDESKNKQGTGYKGAELSGHGANLFLCRSSIGYWIDTKGNVVEGYLYWIPKNE